MKSFLCVTSEQIVRRREEVWRFRVDHDISCETQLLESVSLNSVVHLHSACVLFSWQPFNCIDKCTCDRL